MAFQDGLTTSEIATFAAEEIVAQGGSVTDTFDDGQRLFLRAVLPDEREVQPRDRVQGGVALRATEEDVWVHPYVFRQVCSNGAIIAHATQTRHIERADFSLRLRAELAGAIREAIQESLRAEAFENAAEAMRSSVHSPVDLALTILPTLSRLPDAMPARVLPGLDPRSVLRSSSRSRFDLMNAVTASPGYDRPRSALATGSNRRRDPVRVRNPDADAR